MAGLAIMAAARILPKIANIAKIVKKNPKATATVISMVSKKLVIHAQNLKNANVSEEHIEEANDIRNDMHDGIQSQVQPGGNKKHRKKSRKSRKTKRKSNKRKKTYRKTNKKSIKFKKTKRKSRK
jgi:hypothetical protein